jgi:hypothetical protein
MTALSEGLSALILLYFLRKVVSPKRCLRNDLAITYEHYKKIIFALCVFSGTPDVRGYLIVSPKYS